MTPRSLFRSIAASMARGMLLLAALTGPAGCASYVNIPAEPGRDPAINTIDSPPTPAVVRAALDHVVREAPPPSAPFAVRLPVEAQDDTWREILKNQPDAVRFDSNAADPAQGGAGLPLYDILSIRMRGSDASVDLVVPAPPDERPLYEVFLRGSLGGWRVEKDERWSEAVLRARQAAEHPEPRVEPPPSPGASPAEDRVAAPMGDVDRDTGNNANEENALMPLRPADGGGV